MGGWVHKRQTQRSTSGNKANLQIQRTKASVQGVQIKSVTPKNLPLPLHEIEQTFHRVTGLQRVEGNIDTGEPSVDRPRTRQGSGRELGLVERDTEAEKKCIRFLDTRSSGPRAASSGGRVTEGVYA